MNDTSTLHSAKSISTLGVPTAYELWRRPTAIDMLESGLKEYGIGTAPWSATAERHAAPLTRPVSGGVYFCKVAQNPAIECYYFRGQNDFTASAVSAGAPSCEIDSSLREVTAMLFFAAANARATGETTRPFIDPECRASGTGRHTRTWIAQEENDISEVIRTPQAVHRRAVLADLIERASKLGSLKNGWNSYSAPAPNTSAVGNTKMLLTLASASGIIPERIEPSAMGGVGVTFVAGAREVTVEFYNAGNAHALFSDRQTESLDTAPVPPGVEGYSTLLQEIRRYLYDHNAASQAP